MSTTCIPTLAQGWFVYQASLIHGTEILFLVFFGTKTDKSFRTMSLCGKHTRHEWTCARDTTTHEQVSPSRLRIHLDPVDLTSTDRTLPSQCHLAVLAPHLEVIAR